MRWPRPAPSSSKTANSSPGASERPTRLSQLSGVTSFQTAPETLGVPAVERYRADHLADAHFAIRVASERRADRGGRRRGRTRRASASLEHGAGVGVDHQEVGADGGGGGRGGGQVEPDDGADARPPVGQAEAGGPVGREQHAQRAGLRDLGGQAVRGGDQAVDGLMLDRDPFAAQAVDPGRKLEALAGGDQDQPQFPARRSAGRRGADQGHAAPPQFIVYGRRDHRIRQHHQTPQSVQPAQKFGHRHHPRGDSQLAVRANGDRHGGQRGGCRPLARRRGHCALTLTLSRRERGIDCGAGGQFGQHLAHQPFNFRRCGSH